MNQAEYLRQMLRRQQQLQRRDEVHQLENEINFHSSDVNINPSIKIGKEAEFFSHSVLE